MGNGCVDRGSDWIQEVLSMSQPLVVSGISKSFGSRDVLKDVSFAVPSGEVVGLLGPNGAGKTTLMKIACGLAPADSGSAAVFGKQYPELSVPITSVGTLLSASWIDPRLSCKSAIKIHRIRIGLPTTNGAVGEVLASVGLRGEERTRVGRLSLGMRQRLALALALSSEPQLLVLDEPINGLDADGVIWVREKIKNFAQGGGAVLLSSHLMSEMSLVATRVVILSNGKVVADDSLSELSRGSRRVYVQAVDNLNALLDYLNNQYGSLNSVPDGPGAFIDGVAPEAVFDAARESGVRLTELRSDARTLEETYLSLTGSRDR